MCRIGIMHVVPLAISILVAVVLSFVLPWCAFLAYTTPYTHFPGGEAGTHAVLLLDIPVALLNRMLPEQLRTHMTAHFPCGHTYCFPAPYEVERARYMRVGVPAYALLMTGVIGAVAIGRASTN